MATDTQLSKFDPWRGGQRLDASPALQVLASFINDFHFSADSVIIQKADNPSGELKRVTKRSGRKEGCCDKDNPRKLLEGKRTNDPESWLVIHVARIVCVSTLSSKRRSIDWS